jgi:hypothetical protein
MTRGGNSTVPLSTALIRLVGHARAARRGMSFYFLFAPSVREFKYSATGPSHNLGALRTA